MSYYKEKKALRNAQVVVGTPGRVLDLIEKGFMDVRSLQTLVIDEVDQVLNRNFQETIDEIFNVALADQITAGLQVCLFSATMPKNQISVFQSLVNEDATKILVPIHDVVLKGITQYKVEIPEDDCKSEYLLEFLEHLNYSKVMVFANQTKTIRALNELLKANKHKCAMICGGMKGFEKREAMKAFRES